METNDTRKFPTVEELHASEHRVLKFFNRAQREAMAVSAHDEYIVAARGTGKSEGIDARFIIRNVWAMPGSTGALISPTYSKAWGNTIPAICHALSQWGYIEGLHYFVGRKAPASAGFRLPKRKPLRDAWSNCIHFWNGTIMVVLSFNQGMSANSMSLDWIIGPEAKFLNYDKIKSEVNPANRGNKQYFGDCPWHHSVLYSTDMPTSKMGRWILEKENEMSRPHINFIKNLYSEIKRYEAMPEQTEHVQRQIRELRADLKAARRYQKPVKPQTGKEVEYTVFYSEYDIFDNLEIVGKDFIWQMYRDSPPLIWRTAFMNERLLKVANGFYSALDDNLHFYIPSDNGRFNLSNRSDRSTCLCDGDLYYDKTLYIAFDANAAICSCALGQVINNEFKTIRSFFVKTPQKLQDLVQDVCDYYVPKLKKDLVVYYDHTFVWTTGTTGESYIDTITRIFEKNHWNVTAVYVGQAVRHDWKHQQIDLALKGDPSLLFPTFNLMANEYLKLAMEQTGVKQGKNGFEKDKSAEALPDSPDNPDETKTHITDAWDTLFVGIQFYYTEPGRSDSGVYFLNA